MDQQHDEDGYLIKVLNELRRWTDSDSRCNATCQSTNFYSSTLEELTRRISLEKGLKSEIARLRTDNQTYEAATRLHEGLQKSLQEDILKLKTECECQLKETQALTSERDAQREEIQAFVSERGAILHREQEGLLVKEKLLADQADLKAQVARLSEDNARLSADNVRFSEDSARLSAENVRISEDNARLSAENARFFEDNARLSETITLRNQRSRELDLINRQRLEDEETLKCLSQEPPRAEKPVCTRRLETDKAFPWKRPVSIIKFDRPHKTDHNVIIISSSEDEGLLNKATRRNAPRRSRRQAALFQTSLSYSEDQRGQSYDTSSSDDEYQENEAQRESSRQLPKGLPLLGPRTLPLSRAADLVKASEPFHRDLRPIPKCETTAIFNRQFLNHYLGGGLMALQVRIGTGKQKSLAKEFGITSYMCPNLDHNPWAPPNPGRDGYMFVGLGNEKGAFTIQETHELFVQFAPKQMFYAGRYNLQKVDDLTIDEWRGLDSKVKHRYCETTISKTKEQEPVEAVLLAYDNGRLRAPCVLLRFIEYNLPLYAALSVATQPTKPALISTNTLPETLHGGEKRKLSGARGEPVMTPKRARTDRPCKPEPGAGTLTALNQVDLMGLIK